MAGKQQAKSKGNPAGKRMMNESKKNKRLRNVSKRERGERVRDHRRRRQEAREQRNKELRAQGLPTPWEQAERLRKERRANERAGTAA